MPLLPLLLVGGGPSSSVGARWSVVRQPSPVIGGLSSAVRSSSSVGCSSIVGDPSLVVGRWSSIVHRRWFVVGGLSAITRATTAPAPSTVVAVVAARRMQPTRRTPPRSDRAPAERNRSPSSRIATRAATLVGCLLLSVADGSSRTTARRAARRAATIYGGAAWTKRMLLPSPAPAIVQPAAVDGRAMGIPIAAPARARDSHATNRAQRCSRRAAASLPRCCGLVGRWRPNTARLATNLPSQLHPARSGHFP